MSSGQNHAPAVVRAGERTIRRGMTLILVLATIAGVAGGVGAIAFRLMIGAIQALFFSDLLPRVSFYAWGMNLGVMLLPALGAAIIAPVVYHLAPETRGTGIPETIDTYTRRQGRMRPRVAILKVVVSAITIGSGGSAGREGPIAQIGGASGSAIGQALKLTDERVKLLVVSGVAAGIAGTFNAPLGGALFAIEVLQRGFNWRGTPSIVLASVVGTAVASTAFGLQPVLPAPPFYLQSASQLGSYAVLGLAFGLLSYCWVRVFYLFQSAFERLKVTGTLKLVIGGLLVGGIGMLLPNYGVLGVGYQGIGLVLAGGVTLGLGLALGMAKVLATSLTIGSGASGGVFAPTLYVGSMFGAAFGSVFIWLFPGLSTPPLGYSISGMGALIAGATRAPLTSIIIVPEITGDWNVLPALMLSSIVSYYVASYLLKHSSIYTLKLERRGIDIKALSAPDYLDSVTVTEVMESPRAVDEDATVSTFLRTKQDEPRLQSMPIVRGRALAGAAKFADAERVPVEDREKTPVKQIMDPHPPTISARRSVRDAVGLLQEKGLSEVTVVEDSPGQAYLGVFTPDDLVRAHKLGLERNVD